jgi:hypothetical protein
MTDYDQLQTKLFSLHDHTPHSYSLVLNSCFLFIYLHKFRILTAIFLHLSTLISFCPPKYEPKIVCGIINYCLGSLLISDTVIRTENSKTNTKCKLWKHYSNISKTTKRFLMHQLLLLFNILLVGLYRENKFSCHLLTLLANHWYYSTMTTITNHNGYNK